MTKLNFFLIPNPRTANRNWVAGAGHHSFSILEEDDGRFTATSKDQLRMDTPCKFIRSGTFSRFFKTFDAAKVACEKRAEALV